MLQRSEHNEHVFISPMFTLPVSYGTFSVISHILFWSFWKGWWQPWPKWERKETHTHTHTLFCSVGYYIVAHSFSLGNLINYWVSMLSIDSMLIAFYYEEWKCTIMLFEHSRLEALLWNKWNKRYWHFGGRRLSVSMWKRMTFYTLKNKQIMMGRMSHISNKVWIPQRTLLVTELPDDVTVPLKHYYLQ